MLTERGLEPAVRALADRAPLPVELDVCIQERLPDPVEAAAYYVVAEALTNVAKYAQASEVTVELERGNGHACIEVRDDGIGGAVAGRGSGLRGLADRVEALGGRLDRRQSGRGRDDAACRDPLQLSCCGPSRPRCRRARRRACPASCGAASRATWGGTQGCCRSRCRASARCSSRRRAPDEDLLVAAESVGAQIALWDDDARASRRAGARCSRSRSTRS